MSRFRFCGPECGSTGRTRIDQGTLILQEAVPQAPQRIGAVPLEYDAFRTWALGEAWTGSAAMDGLARLGNYKSISRLSGAYLRMYLRHTVDDATVQAAGNEIAQSPEFAQLQLDVQAAIQARCDALKRVPTGPEIASIARDFLKDRYHKQGIAFRGPLNPVIGGIEGVDVVDPVTIMPAATGAVQYTIVVKFEDKYKFLGNRRSGGTKGSIADQPAYDTQRRHWADQLNRGEYGRVFLEYHKAFYFGDRSVREGSAFASLMYAIESAGMTPGPLPWSVNVPMQGLVGTS